MKLPIYPAKKDPDIEWLGEVPDHWEVQKLSLHFIAKKGSNAAQLTKEYCSNIEGNYPVYSGQTENDGVMSCIDSYEFDAGSEGYLFSTTVGAKAMTVMHLRGKFSLSQNCMVIIPASRNIVTRFYYYHLQPLFTYERGLIPEHMQASFRMDDLYQYRIAIPPPDEQRTIADFLDSQTSKIDTLLAKKRELIDKLKEKRTALISRTVTRGLPPEAARAAGLEPPQPMKESRVDWLGEIQEHWEVQKISLNFMAKKGSNAAQLTKEYCSIIEGVYPVYSGQTENDGVMSCIDSYEFDAGSEGYLFSTTVGAKAMSVMHLKGKFSLSQNCMVIIPTHKKLVPRYYYYHFQPLFSYERGLIPEHMQASFRMEDLYQYRIAIPPKKEQHLISDFLDVQTSKIDEMIAKIEAAIERLLEYRVALISSAVTGKIDVRGEVA